MGSNFVRKNELSHFFKFPRPPPAFWGWNQRTRNTHSSSYPEPSWSARWPRPFAHAHHYTSPPPISTASVLISHGKFTVILRIGPPGMSGRCGDRHVV